MYVIVSREGGGTATVKVSEYEDAQLRAAIEDELNIDDVLIAFKPGHFILTLFDTTELGAMRIARLLALKANEFVGNKIEFQEFDEHFR